MVILIGVLFLTLLIANFGMLQYIREKSKKDKAEWSIPVSRNMGSVSVWICMNTFLSSAIRTRKMQADDVDLRELENINYDPRKMFVEKIWLLWDLTICETKSLYWHKDYPKYRCLLYLVHFKI